ncbi:MAG: helix-turn-helix transcriptional regulator [Ignavibacteria bacterium]|nr:helix-turn-helix transcriptional regulator [Ignavibacteria bacterium]MBK9183888.1 helix-turn-helix transcriptional regulator [Ignavibacteria bacterium]
MNSIDNLLTQIKPEDRQFYDWQFALAQRIAQIMEAKGLNQREFAKRARLTEAQVSALLHTGANPNLSTLARISALLEAELLTWTRADVHANDDSTQTDGKNVRAAVYRIDEYHEEADSDSVMFPYYQAVAER